MTDWVYDIECFPNLFCCYIANAETRTAYGFEISDRKNEREDFFQILRHIYKNGDRMVGFNNYGFDYPVVHFLLKNKDKTYRQLYNYAMKVINADKDEVFQHQVPSWKQFITQLDLYKVNHFDNAAKATSLKALEFNMRADNIGDLPYGPDQKLKNEQKDEVLAYNKHDVIQTYYFYNECLDKIRFREELSEKLGRDFLNANDTKIGKDYFIMKLEESNPGCCYTKDENGKKKPRQTRRESIPLGDRIFSYVKFNRPEFQAVKSWFEKQDIKTTKGAFDEITEPELGQLANYAKMRTKKTKIHEYPGELPEGHWVEERELKSKKISLYQCHNLADRLNTVVDGYEFNFGTGGLHQSIENQIVDSTDEKEIIDVDVASYYPNLAIVNELYPEHLGEHFYEIYKDVYYQRKQYPKGTAENAMMKLALNGVFGDSNNDYSVFHDPYFAMSVTVNGQLLLCMLAEALLDVPTLELIQSNTDGLTVRVNKDYKDSVWEACNWWQDITGLELEYNYYKRMAIANVNNYLALDYDDKIKQKGGYQSRDFDWHQNQSKIVVPHAAERALLFDEDVEDVIFNHNNIYDFMIRAKTPKGSRLVTFDKDSGKQYNQQKVTRYYVSKDGLPLYKVMPPLKAKTEDRWMNLESGWLVTVCNDISNYSGNINYEYYIREARKLVDPLLEG